MAPEYRRILLADLVLEGRTTFLLYHLLRYNSQLCLSVKLTILGIVNDLAAIYIPV